MNLSPTSVDIVVFVILFIFAILAFLKGFIKDFFSTLNLILATIASYILGPIVSKFFVSGSGASQIMIDLGIRFGVFIAFLIIGAIVSSKISKPLSAKIPNSIDQSLGFGFGFAKGYLILSFVVAVILSFFTAPDASNKGSFTKKSGPRWLQESKSYGILLVGANLVKPFIDNMTDQVRTNAGGETKEESPKKNKAESIDNFIKAKKLYDQMNEDQNKAPSSAAEKKNEEKVVDIKDAEQEEKGYTKQELEKMKRLIEIMGN